MQQLPFDAAPRRPLVAWPAHNGPPATPRRALRPPELWELDFELFPGERVLEDAADHATDALLRLARYLTVRIAAHAALGEWERFAPEFEREAALEYLAAVPASAPERRWLRAALAAVSESGGVTPSTVSRLSAAAAMAAQRAQPRGAFALYRVAYLIASRRGWHRHAARIARAIASAAAAGEGPRSSRLWSRRARVHDRRAA